MELQQMNNYCPICLDNFKRPYSIGCSHIFCMNCINKWLEDNNTCPVCRQKYVRRFPIPIALIKAKYKTRKITEYWRGFKAFVKIQQMLDEHQDINGIENSCIYLNEILKYIYENRWILNSNNKTVYNWCGGDRFKNILKDRLKHFSKNPNFKEGKIWEYKFRDILK